MRVQQTFGSRWRGPMAGILVLVVLGCFVFMMSNRHVGSTYAGINDQRVLADDNTSTYVVLGNGCFWERQYAYVNIEMSCQLQHPTPRCSKASSFGRPPQNVSTVVGYYGGTTSGPACYHHAGDSEDGTLYDRLGHAEAERVRLDAGAVLTQWKVLLEDFFASFGKDGSRPDPGDVGGAYRSFLGIPGSATDAEAMRQLVEKTRAAIAPQMTVRHGQGDDGDVHGVVWLYDTDKLPQFRRGELYHQFHSDFRTSYEHQYFALRKVKELQGAIGPTGCPESGSHW